MKRVIRVGILLIILLGIAGRAKSREVELLDRNWRFINQEVVGGESPSLDHSQWEQVTVPHDWAIRQHFDMKLDLQWIRVNEDREAKPKLRTGRTGALPAFGIGWYRRELEIPQTSVGKRVFIEFDGAMSLAKVYVNGKYVGECPYGYTSFSFDITNQLNVGGRNVLAVRLENNVESSRWYTGAGLYRKVRLVTTHPVHVVQWGTSITTPQVSSRKAAVVVRTEIANLAGEKRRITLVTDLFDPAGKKVASSSTTQQASELTTFEQKFSLAKPQRWSLENRSLYRAVSNIYVGDERKDQYESSFGIRSIGYDAKKGLLLNDRVVKIKGVCMHHDLGPLGAAVNERALQRQLEILQEMGCNAIRTSHNPPTPELLRMADEMGFLMQVEAFDEWRIPKNRNGYSQFFDQWAEKDLKAMIRRDRNHPSVIMWSIGNEIRDQNYPEGAEVAKFLTQICHDTDPTRPVTLGMNNIEKAFSFGWETILDIVGFNYRPDAYKKKHQQYPDKVFYGSETVSTLSSRGVYHFPVKEVSHGWTFDYQMSSYDLSYPNWGTTPETEWASLDDNDFTLGEFVWTGFDYLGEPTPYNEATPAKSSYFGIVDLAGLKKDRFYLYQSRWSNRPVLHLLPHWTWPGREGEVTPVYCYTNYPKAELFVNGESMGIQEKHRETKYTRYRLMWPDVRYTPGEIRVVAYNATGKAVAEQVVTSAGAPHSVRFTPDRKMIRTGGEDLSFVTVEVLDKDGNLCPTANNYLYFQVEGAGSLKALCNGDPTDQTAFSSTTMRVFNGKLVAVIAGDDFEGDIKLSLLSIGLTCEPLILQTRKIF